MVYTDERCAAYARNAPQTKGKGEAANGEKADGNSEVERMTGDLISREALLNTISETILDMRFSSARARMEHEQKVEWAMDRVGEAPAVDAAPVVHGRWIDRDGKTWCSECCKSNKAYMPPYCPHCGAKMDLE